MTNIYGVVGVGGRSFPARVGRMADATQTVARQPCRGWLSSRTMGMVFYMTAAPANGNPADPDRFTALLADLIDSDVACRPVVVLSGDAGEDPDAYDLGTYVRQTGMDAPVGTVVQSVRNRPPRGVEVAWSLTVRYAGSDRREILTAARTAAFDTDDVCAYFLARPDSRARQDIRVDAAVFATRAPAQLCHVEPFGLCQDGTLRGCLPRPGMVREFPVAQQPDDIVVHSARWYLSVSGKSGMEAMGPAMPACARHFGPDHFAGCFLA